MGKKINKKRILEFQKSSRKNSKEVVENSKEENLYGAIIKEFSHHTKQDGLIVGTNEVFRLLEKEKLAAVFLFTTKASPPVYQSLSQWCKITNVPFIILQEKDKFVLGSEFPVSITYGIKKESLKALPRLDELLEKLKNGRKNKKYIASSDFITFSKTELLPTKKSVTCKKSDSSVFHHMHEGQSAKKIELSEKVDAFISLAKYSVEEIDFPNYNSVVHSGLLSIK